MNRFLVYTMFMLFAVTTVQAQHRFSLPFSSFYDEDAWLSMGLQYNYVNSTYKIGLKENWASMGTNVPPNNEFYIERFQSIQSEVSHGMSVGLPIELRATDNLSATFQPTFVFINNTGIVFHDIRSVDEPIIIKMRHGGNSGEGANFNAFEFPFNIRFRSDEKTLKNKFNRYRGYITAGARYTRWANLVGEYNEYETIMANGNPVPQPLVLKPGYFSWEAGLGVEIFFPFFRMSPEIKFIQSVGDVLDRNRPFAQENSFMAPLDKTFIRNIQFSLIFQ